MVILIKIVRKKTETVGGSNKGVPLNAFDLFAFHLNFIAKPPFLLCMCVCWVIDLEMWNESHLKACITMSGTKHIIVGHDDMDKKKTLRKSGASLSDVNR